jgi:hypothetical protein
MTSSVKPVDITFDADRFWVTLSDGRVLGVPLSWFPVLESATPEQRTRYSLSLRGLHWEELDEDVSVEGLLAGHGDMTNRRRRVAAAE